jgi:phosphosulfolactate phosphohydrolase-like enzyme
MKAAGQFQSGAGTAPHKFPRIALEVDRRSTLAGCARTCRAVILTLESDTEALLLASSHRRFSFSIR